MPERLYVTIAEAIEIQRQLIEEFGGSAGMRDQGLLEAAIFRPQLGYYASLMEEAAALMESLANNHPFLDRNKRAAFAITDTFLRLNGFHLDVEATAAYRFIVKSIARGDFRFARIQQWIEANLRKVGSDE